MQSKYLHAAELFEKGELFSDVINICSVLGCLFNYWGLRSICKKYANDYVVNENNKCFMKRIPNLYFSTLNNLMNDFLTQQQIEDSINCYLNAISIYI